MRRVALLICLGSLACSPEAPEGEGGTVHSVEFEAGWRRANALLDGIPAQDVDVYESLARSNTLLSASIEPGSRGSDPHPAPQHMAISRVVRRDATWRERGPPPPPRDSTSAPVDSRAPWVGLSPEVWTAHFDRDPPDRRLDDAACRVLAGPLNLHVIEDEPESVAGLMGPEGEFEGSTGGSNGLVVLGPVSFSPGGDQAIAEYVAVYASETRGCIAHLTNSGDRWVTRTVSVHWRH